jgi:hypothetical protein
MMFVSFLFSPPVDEDRTMIDENRVRSRSRPKAGERAAGQERQTVFVVVLVALVL